MAEPTYEELKAKLAEMEKQGGGRRSGSLEFRVGEEGGVSVYGLGRFPVTLYYEQWIRRLEAVPQLRTLLEENKAEGKLKHKDKQSSLFSRERATGPWMEDERTGLFLGDFAWQRQDDYSQRRTHPAAAFLCRSHGSQFRQLP